MRSLDFFIRFSLSILWLLLMSIVGILLIPIFFGNLNFNYYVARFGVFGLRIITRIRVEHDSRVNLDSYQPCIYIGNHQDNFDVFIFGSLFPKKTIVVGKRELAFIPFFNLFYYAAGNVFIHRSKHLKAIAGISFASKKIKKSGVSVMIFPEGTRNRSGKGLLPFKKGAFHMAIETGLPLVPLVAEPIRSVLNHQSRRISPGVIRVRVLDPIPTAGLTRADVDRLATLSRERMLAAFASLDVQSN